MEPEVNTMLYQRLERQFVAISWSTALQCKDDRDIHVPPEVTDSLRETEPFPDKQFTEQQYYPTCFSMSLEMNTDLGSILFKCCFAVFFFMLMKTLGEK